MPLVFIDTSDIEWSVLRVRKWTLLKLARLLEEEYAHEDVDHIVDSLDYVIDLVNDIQTKAAGSLGEEAVYGNEGLHES